VRIDLNADVGESYGAFQIGEDKKLFNQITSVNIACGFHAGDFSVMNRTVVNAKKSNLAIGAHPGYPDLQGFGRRSLEMEPTEIYEMVIYQIGALKAFCELHDVRLSHVKPHGALYNNASTNIKIADAIAKAVKDIVPHAILFGLCNSQLIEAGKQVGLKTAREAFADRRYDDDGQLVSRTFAQSILHGFNDIQHQVGNIVFDQKVQTISGKYISLEADTICFHGDGQNVAENTKAIREWLNNNQVAVKSVEI
jgi:UPF0271 protein